jgi:hypothetical protein
VFIVTVISIQSSVQPFFIQATGSSTVLRQIIIVVAALLFLISGVIIYLQYLKTKFIMLYWFGLGLLLLFLAISTNLLVITIGTPISWTLRITQLLGGVYLLITAIVILKEAKIQQISADEALANFLTNQKSNLQELLRNVTDAIIITDPKIHYNRME